MEMMPLQINSKLPAISSNFEEVRSRLLEELKRYDLIVDQDSVKVAKKMATEINKLSKEIDTVRKETVKELQAPIKEFETKAKELVSLCQESRQNLLSQVKVFEDKERERAKTLLEAELKASYDKFGVSKEFQTVTVEDLAILSNLTKTGLAAKAKKAIEERVVEAKRFQEKIEHRLLTLETICYKGGLKAPLTRVNIDHFLFEKDDDIYLDKLTTLIANEVRRQELIQCQLSPTPQQSQEKKQLPQTKTPKSGKATFVVTATFEVEVDVSLGDRLVDMLVKKFKKTGFKQIPKVDVVLKDEVTAA